MKLDHTGNVRLQFFLARQSEGLKNSRVRRKAVDILPEQQAAVLAVLALMEQHGGKMRNQEIGRFLTISNQRLSTLLRGEMTTKGLVIRDGGYYQITEKGELRLAEFVDLILGTPASIETQLRNHPPYLELMKFTGRLVSEDLKIKFSSARDKPSRS